MHYIHTQNLMRTFSCYVPCVLFEKADEKQTTLCVGEKRDVAKKVLLPRSFVTTRINFLSILSGFLSRKALRVCIANLLVKDSRCRGGIVNIRSGCSRAPFARLRNSTALRRPRVSTSNSLSDLSQPHPYTHVRENDRIYAQRDIRGYGDDHLKPRHRQCPNPTAL